MDDFSLPADERGLISEHAEKLLRDAKVYGVLPTSIPNLVKAAKLSIKYHDDLLAREVVVSEKVKRALGKLQGFLDRSGSTIFIDGRLKLARRNFVAIHEIGHDFLPAHRMTYEILEDSDAELDEGTRETFEREANCFASDVLFQLEVFTKEAVKCEFGIGAPVKILSKRYGTSIYSTIRRYTQFCGRPASVLVCDQPTDGIIPIRRFIPSPQFTELVGEIKWPEFFAKDSWFYHHRPLNKFMLPTACLLECDRGEGVFMVEAYDTTRQIFFFIYPR